ncbi:uncharacterized protein TRAVEDRAFT_61281 [Trametes versicolor FP-101664 SS1]|uniref:uncharacterized protein n=1 Tax=Trametes versicolor (strain FP-101664) TaxID=717944 RepID=UPI0004622017|nr:uncharacterized protein TRAVEDRAFT_61281 [Trametes versicolor FP-101664 SS1]EIW52275.1 hypothetical protein TRAVEDRAFT_61281 [Trametes versicolor FP-101664 SS1]
MRTRFAALPRAARPTPIRVREYSVPRPLQPSLGPPDLSLSIVRQRDATAASERSLWYCTKLCDTRAGSQRLRASGRRWTLDLAATAISGTPLSTPPLCGISATLRRRIQHGTILCQR